jgi:N5-(carboxyethyl)ornithine synthase
LKSCNTLGVISRSLLENERRVPIHPDHFDLIPGHLREHMMFEEGYGEPFGVPDAELAVRFGGVRTREELLGGSGVVLLAKPKAEDLRDLSEGGVLWGWPHCVQQREITQTAIDRRQTLLAWEAMYEWRGEMRDMHLFYRNNEMAGYCGVMHAFERIGTSGHYGSPQKAVVLSFGSVSRGAVFALQGLGVNEITVYTQRPPTSVANAVLGVRYGQMRRGANGGPMTVVEPDGRERLLRETLGEADVIVNGILQDTRAPLMFLDEGEERLLKKGCLVVDVSCDLAMGFPFSRPTSFNDPVFDVGDCVYYAVDHSPSWLWRSASWEISRVVVSFLETVMGGPEAWESNETIRRCVEIRDGVAQNKDVLSFQQREAAYPHVSVS